MEGQRRRVLVIDDDEKLRNMLRRVLAPEHDVTLLARAQDALDTIRRGERFDLILCDLMLSEISGIEFYDLVGEVAPEVLGRIVFTTGGAYTASAEVFLARPEIVHLEKPFAPLDEFRATVRRLLAARPG